MTNKEIINELKKSRLIDLGFDIEQDRDKNINLVKRDKGSIARYIGIPYSRVSDEIFSASASIVFVDLQKLYTDLCYAAILRDKNQKPKKSWLEEQYGNYSINSNTKMESPNGLLHSVYNGYSLTEYYEDTKVGKDIDIKNYVSYLEKFYQISAEPFFSNVPDLKKLDEITENLDIYNLGLYLTGIPLLKKIVLMHIVDNPYKKEALKKYRDQLNSVQSNKTIEALLHSLENIEIYFDSKKNVI